MALARTCPHCGTPTRGRCRTCRAERYGQQHQTERRQWTEAVATGTVRCYRCNKPIAATADWHLDHPDDGEGTARQPSHAHCNVAATRSM